MGLTHQERMELYRIRILLQAPMSFLALSLLPALSTMVLWNFLPRPLLLGWVVFVYLVGIFRVYTWRQLKKLVHSEDLALVRSKVRAAVMAMMLMGTAWGSLGFGINIAGDPRAEGYIVLVIFGIAAGAVFTSAAWPPAVLAYVLPLLLPFSVSVFIRLDWYFTAIGAGVVFYLLLITSFVRQYNIWLDEFIRLQINNARLVDELTVARDRATEASVAKSRFLANISHELRTPLNAILGFSEVIRDGVPDKLSVDAIKEYATYIHEGGDYLLRLINDILDYSKIEAARMDLTFGRVALKDTIQSCLSMIKSAATKKSISLELLESDDVVIEGDELRIRQILMNLLSNAIKFTPAGGSVSAACGFQEASRAFIRVKDTGIGMSPDEVAIAMEPFGQVASAQQREGLQGTGLGLPLSKSLVELHGGELVIDTMPGHGTTVTAFLPIQHPEANVLH